MHAAGIPRQSNHIRAPRSAHESTRPPQTADHGQLGAAAEVVQQMHYGAAILHDHAARGIYATRLGCARMYGKAHLTEYL